MTAARRVDGTMMAPQDLGGRGATGTAASTSATAALEDRPLRTSLVTSEAELGGVRPAHDALVRTTRAPVSMSWEALSAWLRAHPDEFPHVVLVHRGSSLVGVAALTRRRERAWTRFGKAGVPGEPFQLLHADDAAAAALVEALARSFPRRGHRVVLDDLPDPDPSAERLGALLPRAVRERSAEVPVLNVPTGPGAGGARPTLSRNTRQAVAKARNRARREGHDLQTRWISHLDEVEAILPALVALHIRRNVDLGRRPLLLEPAERTLFEETLRANVRSHRARLLLTTVDGELAAYAVCFAGPRRWWVWSNYADPAWLRYSPGTVSNAEVVRAAEEEPDVDQVDWGNGLQRYKLSGAVHVEHRQRVESASLWVSGVLGALRVTGRVRRRLRGSLRGRRRKSSRRR